MEKQPKKIKLPHLKLKKPELTQTQKIEIQKNKEHLKDRNTKFKLYALFQFFSTSSIFLISLALGLVVYLGVTNSQVLNKEFFKEEFKAVMEFDSKESLHLFTSFLTYLGFFTWFFSIVFALLLHTNKQRSLFDTAFLLFFFVPMLSNIIALFAQISETIYKIPSTHVDRYATKIEYLEELENFTEKEKKVKTGKKSQANN